MARNKIMGIPKPFFFGALALLVFLFKGKLAGLLENLKGGPRPPIV